MKKKKSFLRYGTWYGCVMLALAGMASLAVGASKSARPFQRGVVATDHPLASRAGRQILRRGGNAVDAACAAVFALGVVNPTGSGIGGGGFMLIKHNAYKGPRVIDFRETAPAAAHRTMFLEKGVHKHASQVGGLAVGIPGEVRGCAVAVMRYGKLSLHQVMRPAIRMARRGFPVGLHLYKSLVRYQKRFSSIPGLARIFYPGGRPVALGQRLRRPRLARTLRAIAKHGSDAFYLGWIAKDIVRSVKAAGGIFTLHDLAQYRVKERQVLQTPYRGHQVFLMPPPSSGGVALIQSLNILRRRPLKKLGHNASGYLHFVSEALQHAFADRARFLGDTDFVKVPVAALTSQAYADKLEKRIKDKVSPSASYGSKAPPKAGHRDGGTSHISVIDAAGNAVALTTTINTGFGSLVVAEKSGVILNNQMDDFTTRPGKANAFGLIQSENNTVAPGKRPLSSMSPTLVMKDGRVVLAVGGSGGPTIITGTLQTLINVVDFDLDLRDAVSRPRIHHQWMPPMMFIESDLPRDVRQALTKRGHRLRVWKKPFTAVQAVQWKNGRLYGASDPRKQGATAGW